jgi:hypothetical protein
MSTEQIVAAVTAFVLANGGLVFGISRSLISRAIAYTHLERDVREMKKEIDDLKAKHEKVQFDLKGVAQIARKNSPPTNS